MNMNTKESAYRAILGSNIRKIRKRVNMTQDVFSEKIGIEPSSLSNIENGKSFPSALTLINIQQQFGVRPDEIFDFQALNQTKTLNEDILTKLDTLDEEKKQALWTLINSFIS